MLSSYFKNIGTIPWVMMYTTDDLNGIFGREILSGEDLSAQDKISDSRGTVQKIRQFLSELEMEGSAAFMYYYEPSYESVMRGYAGTSGMADSAQYLAEMFAKLCGNTRARAVFLSLDRLNNRLDHEFYSYLKKAESAPVSGGSTGSYRRSVSDYIAVSADRTELPASMISRTTLWDFTDQFYPLGWIAGGGVSSCLTVYSDLFSENSEPGERYSRILRSVIALDKDSASPERKGIAAGITLRNLSRTIDLSGVDALEFTFALNHPGMIVGTGHETGTVVFIVGTDDFRAEFTVQDAAYGQIQTYVCDLSDYEFRDRVDYMGILVYGDHEMYLDLSSVSAMSRTMPQDELERLFAVQPLNDAPEADRAMIIVVSGIVFIASASTAVLLIRHDMEEHRERRKRLLEERHSRRERIRRN